ncbi:hypothetical protein [Spiroplasma endosymbiont of Ammophila pubescens]|uniref:hypothetical protein n=1 Tax=Spiroplasma endosymbiont of Ammophila pubescens TaxID=3066315 RepID=UPI0032B15453
MNIIRNNEIFYSENQNQSEVGNIYIYYVNQNHYNFVLTEENDENKDTSDAAQEPWNIPLQASVITNTNLGELRTNTPEMIINEISRLNPRFDISRIYVTDITQNDAKIVPFVPPLWKGENPTIIHFSLPKTEKNQLIVQYNNVRQDDWKTKPIDLKNNNAYSIQ